MHHSVMVMAQRGDTKVIVQPSESKRVKCSKNGKGGPPPLESKELVLQRYMAKHVVRSALYAVLGRGAATLWREIFSKATADLAITYVRLAAIGAT